MKNKRLLFGIIAIALAFLLVFVGIPIINSKYNRTVTVLRVTSNIEKGTVIDASQLTNVTVIAAGMPDGVLSDASEVVGKYAIVDFVPGDFVLPAKLSSYKQEDTSVLTSLEDGTVAVTITAPNLSGTLANKIQTGDIVKVYNAAGDQLTEYYELQYLKIVGITNNDGTQIEEVAGDASRMAATYTFAVTYEQAEKLIALDHDGELHFVLVSRGDVERAEKLMQKQTALLEEISKRNFNQNSFDYDDWSAKWEAANG